MSTSPLPLGDRRYDLDWVRIGAFLLLILYHVGMYYVSWDWHVKSPHPSTALEPLMMLSSPWRLSLLFLVSGVASAYLMAREPAGFLGSRSVRLLVPLFFGMAVIVPPQSYLEVVEKIGYSGSYGDFLGLYFTAYHGFCKGRDCLILPTWNHLWFVAYLWVYTVILWAAARLPAWMAVLRRRTERALGGVGVIVIPVIYLALVRMTLAPWFPATHALVGDWYNHALYGFNFLMGFVLAGTRAPWAAMERLRWPALGGSVLAWGLFCVWVALPEEAVWRALLPGVVVLYALLQWLPIVAVLGFASLHLRHDSPARRYLTTAIFPVYILHQTLIVVFAHTLKPAHLDPSVEAMMLIAITASGSLMAYELIRRVPLLRPLFGLSLHERKAVPMAAPVSGHA